MWKAAAAIGVLVLAAGAVFVAAGCREKQEIRMRCRQRASAEHADSNQDLTGKSFEEWVGSIEQRLIKFNATGAEFGFAGHSSDDGVEYKWELFLEGGMLTAYVDDQLVISRRIGEA